MADSESPEERPKRQEPPPLEFMRPGEQAPPAPSTQPPAAWVPRPEDFAPGQAQVPGVAAPPATGRVHTYAGVVLLLAAFTGIGYTIYLSVQFLSPADYANLTQNITPEIYALSQICALLGIWAEVAALLGGAMAIQRSNWRLAVGCGIFAAAASGAEATAFLDPVLGLFALLSVVGLLLVFRARREFLT